MVNELIDKQKKYRGENNETKVQDNETKINVKDKVADIFHTTIIDNHEQSEEVQKQLEETHEQSEEVQKQLEETHEQSEEVQKQLDNKFISRIKVIKTLYMSLDDSLR
jgi:predicted HicB family RNase H-like nuclease